MLHLQGLTYAHPNKEILFRSLNLSVASHEKIALTGNNGTGKSTLLKIIAKVLQPLEGRVVLDAEPYLVPQVFGQFNHLTIAEALGIGQKRKALNAILDGDTSNENFRLLNDDWTLEDRCAEALRDWQLEGLDLSQKMETLSGGQKTKVFLAGLTIHRPTLVLLDEPSNHLDRNGRERLLMFIRDTKSSLVVVSHDRELLNLLDTVCELTGQGLTVYGGNYNFYAAQKQLEKEAFNQDLQSKEKALRKAKEKERDTAERQQKLNSRGRAKQEKAGVARIMLNTLRNKAENSTAKLKTAHTEKIDSLAQELQNLRSSLPDIDQMKFGFAPSSLHKGKLLVNAAGINVWLNGQPLWPENKSFQLVSGDRVALKGQNGAGKTTLIKLLLGQLAPSTGTIHRAECRSVFVDQDYSLLDNGQTVFEQAQEANTGSLQEHEVKIRLTRFLFTKEDWEKPCRVLSGGERMRLLLCCLTLGTQAPDIIVLDEPTNNLDLQNIEILTAAIDQYYGTLVVVSHDEVFLEQVRIERTIGL